MSDEEAYHLLAAKVRAAELRALLAKATAGSLIYEACSDQTGLTSWEVAPERKTGGSEPDWSREVACFISTEDDVKAYCAMHAALPALLDVAEAAQDHAWHNCQCTAGFRCSRCVLRAALAKLGSK